MKAYTDIEQSKKLAEILPIESADMYYPYFGDNKWGETARFGKALEYSGEKDIPCWGLAVLLDVLPKSLIYTPNQALDGYCCKNIMHDLETYGDNPIDACYEMIIKLHVQKLL